jgi:hypothetical protein
VASLSGAPASLPGRVPTWHPESWPAKLLMVERYLGTPESPIDWWVQVAAARHSSSSTASEFFSDSSADVSPGHGPAAANTGSREPTISTRGLLQAGKSVRRPRDLECRWRRG